MTSYETLLVTQGRRRRLGVAEPARRCATPSTSRCRTSCTRCGTASATTTTSAASCSPARATPSAPASTGPRRSPTRTTPPWRPATTPATRRRGCTTTPAATSARRRCDLWKPVIAAVQGMACGGAFYMLGEVEFIIAADDAVFFDPHVTYGMTAAFEPMQMLVEDAVPGDHAPVAARRPRADVGRAGPRDRARDRGRAARRAARAGRVGRAGHRRLARRSSSRGRCGRCGPRSRCPRTQAIGLANLFTRIGSDAAAFKAGQDRFASGERPQWRAALTRADAGEQALGELAAGQAGELVDEHHRASGT